MEETRDEEKEDYWEEAEESPPPAPTDSKNGEVGDYQIMHACGITESSNSIEETSEDSDVGGNCEETEESPPPTTYSKNNCQQRDANDSSAPAGKAEDYTMTTHTEGENGQKSMDTTTSTPEVQHFFQDSAEPKKDSILPAVTSEQTMRGCHSDPDSGRTESTNAKEEVSDDLYLSCEESEESPSLACTSNKDDCQLRCRLLPVPLLEEGVFQKLAVGLGVELDSILNPKRPHRLIFYDTSPYQSILLNN